MAERITVEWQISDGYVGASRPQSFEVDPEDFIGLSRDEAVSLLDQMAVEDMMQKCSAAIRNENEVVNRIMEAAEQADADQ